MTPAIRFMEREKVPFTEHPYEHDAGTESFGEEAATKLGQENSRGMRGWRPARRRAGFLLADERAVLIMEFPGWRDEDLVTGGRPAVALEPFAGLRTLAVVGL